VGSFVTADASATKNRLRKRAVLVWLLAWLMMPLLCAAQDHDLLTIESAASLQQLRTTHDPALQAILQEPAFGSLHLARAHAELLSDHGNTIRIDLGDGHVVTAHKTRFYTDAQDISVWEGEISAAGPRARGGSAQEVPRDESNAVTLVVMRESITGSVRVDGQLYNIMPLSQGEHAVVKVDESKLPENKNDALPSRSSEEQPENPPPVSRARNTISTIRVLIVASKSAIALIGGEDKARAKAELAVIEANQSLTNNALPVRLESAGFYGLDYFESGNMSFTLAKLRDSDDEALGAPVWRLREEHRADLVVMFVKPDPAYCGMGYLNSVKEDAYSAVSTNCITGNYVFAHEIGHNMGAHHDPDTTNNGAYSYGYGYQQKSVPQYWRTVMAYACASVTCNRNGYWSDPHRTYNGLPLGNVGLNDTPACGGSAHRWWRRSIHRRKPLSRR
jgi:hypothetical protein